ncbi:transcription antitermination factor NusB [Anaeromyxobacter oryzae]|uniref:Ribosomal RNA small subunit methyltransferase B n=1 Tax=Anaeromyxobacter oryzae TaxID=2918170 RepID=A0ABN6MWG6_9BACT|nr:transcription antitermination factor NusB [Anaeromyxobacter oryzae]BDG04053.1 ribosomal RNA small subunit methyltransferase B [Anaeromyxobacter oryzae]
MNARKLAFEVLRRVEEGGAYASRALDAALSSAGARDPREAGLATELVYGTLRRALALDAALAPHSKRPIAELDAPARIALRLGAFQLLVLGTPAHAAVGETVALAKAVDHGRAAGYVNAVLRALARAPRFPDPPPLATDPAGHVAAAEALPRWIAEEWVAWLGPDEALALARAMNGPAPLCLRAVERDALVDRLRAAGIAAAPAARAPGGVSVTGASVAEIARAAGGLAFQVQDEAAQLVTLLAAGELRGKKARVLDACAAPGGKAFHLAELLAPGSEVVAVELHPRKADALAREAGRRGLPAVRVICADAAKAIPGLEPGSFDAVLVDAPCAGLGTLRRHPELKLRRAPEDLPRMAVLQREIAASVARYARAGAPVTYSVCSLSRAEGPEIVRGLISDGWRRAAPPGGFPADVLTADGDLLTLPSRHGADGFFAARLVR